MGIVKSFFISVLCVALASCAVKLPESNQYQLSAYSSRQLGQHSRPIVIQVTQPDAVANYKTSQMLYTKKPFQIEPFAKNAWKNPPADMLYPLLLDSLQKTHVFRAVTSTSFAEEVDYRLDTQLLSLVQDFTKKPSQLQFSAKVVLVRLSDNRVMGSKIIELQIPCPTDTPYGGVLAANRATQEFTAMVIDFVMAGMRGR